MLVVRVAARKWEPASKQGDEELVQVSQSNSENSKANSVNRY